MVAWVALLGLPAFAEATFPGSNGKLAFVREGNIWVMNPDGSGLRQMTTSATDSTPAWSADGQKIAFTSKRDGNTEIYVMDVSTATQTRLTNHPASDYDPTWSPDGLRIAFVRDDPSPEIWVMNTDGTGPASLTNGQGGTGPDWSPDGQRIAFVQLGDGINIFAMNADGSGRTQLTHYPPGSRTAYHQAGFPHWSPDGRRIVFQYSYGGAGAGFYSDIAVIDADGGNQTSVACCFERSPVFSPDGRLILFIGSGSYTACVGLCVVPADGSSSTGTEVPGPEGDAPDWQPGAAGAPTPSGYPHPASARLVRVMLVPAFKSCQTPNTNHGGPLAWGSCSPATQASDYLTVGTPDANGRAAKASGSVAYEAISDDTMTAGDEADVRISLRITDVRWKSDLTDYPGEIWTLISQRITDLNNPGVFGDTGTVQDQPWVVEAPCSPTADPALGSTCQTTTTVDALAPGAVQGGDQATWELGDVQVFDGGSDGDRDTGPNTLFMRQGLFVP